MFRTIAERNQYRVRARYLRALTSGGNSANMEDVPNAQDRGDDDIGEEWPVTDSTVHLSLPPEIALSLSGTNPQWASTSGKRSRDIHTTSSVKDSRINEQDDTVSFQPTVDNTSDKATGLDEHGLPLGDWEEYLVDVCHRICRMR